MSFFGDLIGGKAAKRASEFNAKIDENNKKIKDMEAEQIMSIHNDFNVPKFDKTSDQILGRTKVYYLKSGATLEGTPVEAIYETALELETDKDIMQFNAENARDTKINEGIMLQASADLERWRGKVAKKTSYFQAGTSLLSTVTSLKTAGFF